MAEGESAEKAAAQKEPTQADAESSLKSKLSEYENDLKRLQAEFENYRKRVEKERKEWIECGKAEAMRQMLVLSDEFDAAMKHKSSPDAKSLSKGIELLDAKLKSAFKSFKIEEIKCDGHLDANLHDVLLQVEGGEEGKIAQVIRKGYRMGDVILRHAQVSVYNGKKGDEMTKRNILDNKLDLGVIDVKNKMLVERYQLNGSVYTKHLDETGKFHYRKDDDDISEDDYLNDRKKVNEKEIIRY